MYIIPNAYTVDLPLCVDLKERTIVHSTLVRDSPCGWCGKKSIYRIRHYINSDLTTAIVLSACKDHVKQLRYKIDMLHASPEAVHFFNMEDNCPEN